MATKKNRGIVLQKSGVVCQEIPYPKLEINEKGKKRECRHGVILKVLMSNICGSDMHMYRNRTTAEPGLILGHEITGEVIEIGPDVEFIKVGDWVSVPFNVSCGRCRNCIERKTQHCLNSNPDRPGGAYGYVNMGYWAGGQSEYMLVPYADFQLLKIPKNLSKEMMLDVALLSDILPTAYNGAVCAGVTTGSSVYIAGAGPVGMCCIASCQILGASHIFVGEYEKGRLENAKKMGAIPIDLNMHKDISKPISEVLGEETVDCSIDCVGFESCGHHGKDRHSNEERAEVLNASFKVTKYGGGFGIPGLYLPADPGADSEEGKKGVYKVEFGVPWDKGVFIMGGQCPVMKYNRELLAAILAGKIQVAKYMNTTVIRLDEVPQAYKEFNEGAARKYIIDPHGALKSLPIAK